MGNLAFVVVRLVPEAEEKTDEELEAEIRGKGPEPFRVQISPVPFCDSEQAIYAC